MKEEPRISNIRVEDGVVISHVKEDLSAIQTNEEHTRNVAIIAERFASDFGMGAWARVMGLLHDKGKERSSFQSYIRKVSGIDPGAPWHGEDKTHAFVGAQMGRRRFGPKADLVTLPIAGHHTGLQDPDGYSVALTKEFPKGITDLKGEFNLPMPSHLLTLQREELFRGFNHLIRMLYSCLVDADYLDTEKFMQPRQSSEREGKITMREIKTRLDGYLSSLSRNAVTTPLNELRKQIQEECIKDAKLPVGFFSLSVPTGGGKTLSSLAWAVEHALANDLKRIIIAIPFTSVVTQTAAVLTSIFGEESVLEHHSDFDSENIADERLRQRMKLATENWDYPIIVTTNVQLFQSIYSNKPSKCRKLHNLSRSVVILDEVQSLPLEHLQPIIDALVSYNKMFITSVLFSTASLPALSGEIKWGRDVASRLRGVDDLHEIIPEEWQLHDKLRRVAIKIEDEVLTPEALAAELNGHEQVLCVVNTRKIARDVYESLSAGCRRLHLSRMMCSAHIKRTLEEIRKGLNEGEPLKVVATQLIEAGVDIDFPSVYRQEAGLDSILQAAGRCNREGKRAKGEVVVFKLERAPFGSIGRAANAWRVLPEESDWLDPKVMKQYFVQLYSRTATFDKADIKTLLYKSEDWCFETAAQGFRLIEDRECQSVIVNYGGSHAMVEKLRKEGPSYGLLKSLAKYSVNLLKGDFENLVAAGEVEEVHPGIYYVSSKEVYSEEVGLKADNRWQEEVLIL